MGEIYRRSCINYVKDNVECVGYRDYIVKQLETPAIPIERIKQLREYADMWNDACLEMIDNMIKEYSE